MDRMLSLKEKLSFDKVDLTAPDKVIKEVGNELSEITQGMVKCEVKEYDGPIRSFTQTKEVGTAALLTAFQTKTVEQHIDIQSRLGEMGNTQKKFEVCLETPNNKDYKFRLMFIAYDATIYPVTVVLESDIANQLPQYGNGYIYSFKSRKDFQSFFVDVINSDKAVTILQQLINLAGNAMHLEMNEEAESNAGI